MKELDHTAIEKRTREIANKVLADHGGDYRDWKRLDFKYEVKFYKKIDALHFIVISQPVMPRNTYFIKLTDLYHDQIGKDCRVTKKYGVLYRDIQEFYEYLNMFCPSILR